jgi:hypothetical protein
MVTPISVGWCTGIPARAPAVIKLLGSSRVRRFSYQYPVATAPRFVRGSVPRGDGPGFSYADLDFSFRRREWPEIGQFGSAAFQL